ncbi:hypothetical protein [Granulicella sp. S190]|uniref:hypothetical protein n=1 Tax=Granulicella sp. S190 TaxID=1747226 RepID=UPI00131C5AA1|nr:hypothetical protein [Granulicella sp. S190]
MRVVVDESSREVIEQPHFRGMHHLVTASFGQANIFVFDILRRTVSAHISSATAKDEKFWREKLIPICLGILGPAMGLVPMHCACLERGGKGLLVAGNSGAGKSTLSAALSQNGFNYISDDWTYMSQSYGKLVAHGTSAPVKLLPDAVRHFPTLRKFDLKTSMNGELAYEIDVAETFLGQIKKTCEPRWLIFLERVQRTGGEFLPVPSSETQAYLECSVERLPTQLSEASAKRDQTIKALVGLPCWRFRYGGTPQSATQYLHEFVAVQNREVYA